MQNDEQNPAAWQQPDASRSGAPYQAPAIEAPVEPVTESQSVTPVIPVQAVAAPEQPLEELETPEQGDEPDEAAGADDEDILRWQAAEYIEHDRSTGWYTVFAVVVIALIAVAILLFKSWTFALLVPVMALALFVYTRRPPAIIDYALSRKGLYVNDKLQPYDSFRAFSVVSHGGHHWAALIPRKRFQLAQSVYFPEEVGEPLVDMLAARMPMQDAQPDLFDRIISHLRI